MSKLSKNYHFLLILLCCLAFTTCAPSSDPSLTPGTIASGPSPTVPGLTAFVIKNDQLPGSLSLGQLLGTHDYTFIMTSVFHIPDPLCLQWLYNGETVTEIMASHAHNPPIQPSKISPGIPKDIERIILKLLEKDPADRFFSGRQIIDELTHSIHGPLNDGVLQNMEPIVFSPKFIGREEEMKVLKNFHLSIISKSQAEECACLVFGETGSGKTKLLDHFKNFQQLEQVRVLHLSIKRAQAGIESFVPLVDEMLKMVNPDERESYQQKFSNFWGVALTEKAPEDTSPIMDLIIGLVTRATQSVVETGTIGLGMFFLRL